MVDDLEKRLKAQGRAEVPPVDRTFADRLESKLRVDHSRLSPQRRKLAGLLARLGLPRLGVAAAALAFATLAVIAVTSRSRSIPVEVIDGESPPPASQPSGLDGGDGEQVPLTDTTATVVEVELPAVGEPPPKDESAIHEPPPSSSTAEATPVPTITATGVDSKQTPPPLATVVPAPAVVEPRPVPTATSRPPTQPSPTPLEPTATPQPPRPTPAPTAVPTPARPVPAPTVRPTVRPTPTSTPTSTPTPAVADIDLTCQARVSDRGVAVVCSWARPDTQAPITSYTLLRSRNGGPATVVSRQREAAETTFVDRDVDSGDQVTYLVRAVGAGDGLLGESVRQAVEVPAAG